MEQACLGHTIRGARSIVHVDRKQAKDKVALKHWGFLYAHRGTDERLLYLSPYEFVRHWEIKRWNPELQFALDNRTCIQFPPMQAH